MKGVQNRVLVGIFASIGLLTFILNWFPSPDCYAAQEDFPKKEITMICSMAAGGGRDLLMRGVARVMSKHLKVPVVVINVAGAGGVLGATRLFTSTPDGYTIGAATMTEVFSQLMEKTDYDLRKCINIGRAQSSPGFFYVRADSPFRSWSDFKTYGRPVRYGAFSFGTPETVVSMIIANREGWTLKVIGGYKGAAPAILGLIRGDIDLTGSALPNGREHIRAGTLRAIVILDRKRHPDFPDVPVVGDLGYPELATFTPDTWFLVPPGVPINRVRVLEDALMKTIKDPEFIQWAKGAAIDPAWMSGEEHTKVVHNLFSLFEKYRGEIKKYIEQ